MGYFNCPACKQSRHIEDGDCDPRDDRCWFCGTRVPYSEAELARMDAELEADPEAQRVDGRWVWAHG